MRNIELSDPTRWSAIDLRKNSEVGGGDEHESSGANELHEDCIEDDSAVPMEALQSIGKSAQNTDEDADVSQLQSLALEVVEESIDGGLEVVGYGEEAGYEEEVDAGTVEDDTDIFVPAPGVTAEVNKEQPRRSKRTKTTSTRYGAMFFRH